LNGFRCAASAAVQQSVLQSCFMEERQTAALEHHEDSL